MKFIKADSQLEFTAIDVTDPIAVYKKIEKIARLCYKSEGLITQVSHRDLITKLRKLNHTAMLEHHVIVMEVSEDLFKALANNRLKYINLDLYDDTSAGLKRYIVSGSATAWNQAPGNPAISEIVTFLGKKFPLLFTDAEEKTTQQTEEFEHSIEILDTAAINKLPYNIRRNHQAVTAKFIVDRGVSHEIVRHRPVSYAQESTRYCNYALEKFEGELTWILPVWMDKRMLGNWVLGKTG